MLIIFSSYSHKDDRYCYYSAAFLNISVTFSFYSRVRTTIVVHKMTLISGTHFANML